MFLTVFGPYCYFSDFYLEMSLMRDLFLLQDPSWKCYAGNNTTCYIQPESLYNCAYLLFIF